MSAVETALSRAPLDGLLVADLSQVYSGPYCTALLRHLGADVIKVEPPGGEPVRRRTDEATDRGTAFSLLNSGKRSMEVDLRTAGGKADFASLIRAADVLVENYAPGTLDRLGVGHEVLRSANPALIIASCKGYAADTSRSRHRAMDLTVQATTGVLDVTGYPDQPPVKSGAAVADFSAGVHLALGIVAALLLRQQTGEGQLVEVAMQDALLPMLTSPLVGLLETADALPHRTGNRQGGLAYCPWNVYRTSDGWIAILCMREEHWQRLRKLASVEAFFDTRFVSNADRVRNMSELDGVISAWTSRRGRDDLVTQLEMAEVPCAPVLAVNEVVSAELDRSRPMLIRSAGGGYCFGNPIRIAGLPTERGTAARPLGADNIDILGMLARGRESAWGGFQ